MRGDISLPHRGSRADMPAVSAMRRSTSGFTLLEVLVAIGIFAMFSAMAYGGLLRMLESRERIEAERTFWRELTLAFTYVQDDLAQARDRPIRDTDNRVLPAFRGQPTDTRALAESSLDFTRGGVAAFGAGRRSDLQRVAYRLQDGVLQRLYWTALDRAPASVPLESSLLDQVAELQVRFYQQGAWVDRWPPDTAGQPPSQSLPNAVELTLVHKTRGKFTRTFLVNE